MQYNISMNERSETYSVKVGNISIGSQYPIRIQSMTNTDTSDINATFTQIMKLADAGSELVRITVNDEKSAAAVGAIKSLLVQKNYNVLITGDFNFNLNLIISANIIRLIRGHITINNQTLISS